MSTSSSNTSAKLSRGEVEVLTVLHVVGNSGCRLGDLPARLGLSGSLTAAVAEGLQPLVAAGLLTREDDLVMVSAAGKARLTARLAELGLR